MRILKPTMLALLALSTTAVFAQSGSYDRDPYDRSSGSADRQVIRPSLGGFDPVALIDQKQNIKGNPSLYIRGRDGLTYIFANKENRKTFRKNKSRYMAVFRANCPVTFHTLSRKRKGDHNLFTVYKDRLYVFANEEARELFAGDPAKFSKGLPERKKKVAS